MTTLPQAYLREQNLMVVYRSPQFNDKNSKFVLFCCFLALFYFMPGNGQNQRCSDPDLNETYGNRREGWLEDKGSEWQLKSKMGKSNSFLSLCR